MEPLFDLDLASVPQPTDGGLFSASITGSRPLPPRLGRSGPQIRFLHPQVHGVAVGALFGPGPREGILAVSYRGELVLVDTTTWTATR